MQKKKEKEKQLATIMQWRETEHQIPTWEVLSQQKQLSIDMKQKTTKNIISSSY